MAAFRITKHKYLMHPAGVFYHGEITKRFPMIQNSPGSQTIRGTPIRSQTTSSLIQTILSVMESHHINRLRGSRTIPPVGNCTLPRRISLFIFLNYNSIFQDMQGLSDLGQCFCSKSPPQINSKNFSFVVYHISV